MIRLMKWFFILSISAVVLLVWMAPEDDGPAAQAKSQERHNFTQVGYFKTDYKGIRQRLMTFVYRRGTTEEVIQRHAGHQPYTQGGVTFVFYYPTGTPAKDPTMLNRLDYALNLVEHSAWTYRYQRALNGREFFEHKER